MIASGAEHMHESISTNHHTVVIGAGIIGLSVAVELIWRGARVTVVDPREPGSAASDGNTGWVVPALSAPVPTPGLPTQVARWMLEHDSPFRLDLSHVRGNARWLRQFWGHCNPLSHRQGLLALGRLNAESYSGFSRWLENGLTFEWRQPGVTFVSRDAAAIEHVADELKSLEHWGYEQPQWLLDDALRRLHPELSADVAAGVRARREQVVRPESVIAALRAIVDDAGRVIRGSVQDVQHAGGRIVQVETDSGECIAADAVVIAAGAWSAKVGKCLGTHLPVLAGKGYSITVENPELQLAGPLYLADAKIACTPFDGANRFAGMMELTGPDDSINPARLATMANHLDQALPGWELGSRRIAWSGLRPMTPDGLPIIGKVPTFENVYAATGHGMLGVTMAPVTGAIIAELIVNGESSHDISAFEAGRF